jgi:hypothetical protein
VLNSAISVASLFLAPATFGLGSIGLWAVGFAIGVKTDDVIDKATDKVRKEIDAANGDCKPVPPRRVKIADPTWIYDPSGYAYEAYPDRRVAGATATLLTGPSANGPWTPADMTAYGQANPVTTDGAGRYGWDVPQGWWKVQFSKDGFLPASSAALQVLPPHYDVNVALTAAGLPQLSGATAAPGHAVRLQFDRPMRADSIAAQVALAGHDGPLAVQVTAVDPHVDATGATLATSYDLTGASTALPGGSYTVTVGSGVLDYAGRPMTQDATVQVQLPDGPVAGTASLHCATGPVAVQTSVACTLTLVGKASPPQPLTGTVSLSTHIAGQFTPCVLAQTAATTASCTFQFRPGAGTEGLRAITASYAGDAWNTARPVSTTLSIVRRSAALTLSCAPNTGVAGKTVVCRAVATDTGSGTPLTPTGRVAFVAAGGTLKPLACTLLPGGDPATAACAAQVTAFKWATRVVVYGTWLGDRDHRPPAVAKATLTG